MALSLEEITIEPTDAKFGVRIERNLLIPLADGTQVAADLYLPDTPGAYPALLSYYPYHKDDLIGGLVEHPRQYFAERGYASLLVDFRGTGGSEGICTDTFDTVNEGRDGAHVVEWAAGQSWCDGSVGVWGISYGGLMSLAIAAQRPPHLKAIAPVYGCADIWKDFIAPGGCPNCLGNYARESFMLAMDLAPPMFQDPEGRWLRVWKEQLERLNGGDLHSLRWQARPDYDKHWQSRSIPVEKIEVPGFFIGGWRDIFPEAMSAAFARLTTPKHLLMGPWVHTPPDSSPYQPIDWLYELRRWWDYWLKGEQNGIMEEPPVTLFVQGSETWRHEREWPIARTQERVLHVSAGGALSDSAGSSGADAYTADPTVGTAAGLWDPLGTGVGYPVEQAEDDLCSLTYTSEALAENTEIVGSPEALLDVTVEEGDELHLVVKLNAVAPSGSSTLLSTGWLNAAHRQGHERRTPLESGKTYRFRVPMWATSYLVPKGHRLRLSVACADFPRVWPTRSNPKIRLSFGGDTASTIIVPVVPPTADPIAQPPIARPAPGINRAPWTLMGTPRWEIERDMVSDTVSASLGAAVTMQLPTGGTLDFQHCAVAKVARDRPDGVMIEAEAKMDIRMPAGEHVVVDTQSRFTRETMLFEGRVLIDGRVFFEKRWSN